MLNLVGGDLAVVGEKGGNLSAGSRARVTLARAIYSDADLLLIDDLVATLDVSVRNRLFKNLFLNKLSNKTRVLVTHSVEYMHLVDHVVVMSNGRVVA